MKINNASIEITAHMVGWLIFLAIPFLFFPEPPAELKQEYGKFSLLPIFISSLFLILLFYINYFILIPKFLFTNRYIFYILSCTGCIALKSIIPIFLLLLSQNHPKTLPMHHPPVDKFVMQFAFSNSVLLYVVIILASIGLRLNKRWKLTEQEKLKSELSLLKSQVNPHFLFNTLNSIYAETLGKADNASEMILKLSDIMRYTITEAHYDKVSLKKEFDYITNYIELQKLRLPPKINLVYHIKGEANESEIAPLLLIPFIENAFKHGVNSEQKSSIIVRLEIEFNQLHLSVSNKKVDTEKTIIETTGLGINNTRQRLNLIYPGKHLLTINETESDYIVSLNINLG